MNKFLKKTIPELSELRKTAKAADGVFINDIVKAIKKKTPDAILKKANLTEFESNYQDFLKQSITELTTFLSPDEIKTRKVIDILICLYILSGQKTKLIWSRSAPAVHTEKYKNQDLAFIKHQNGLKPTRQPAKLISDWINGRRIMPASAPFPGIYSIHKTPYGIEICDNMAPYSPVDYQAVKKGVQIAVTTIVENCIAYYWKERPVDQMYLTGTEELIKKFNTKRLGPLMESAGLIASPQIYSQKSRKSGDTIEMKEYFGGNLTMGSIQSSAHARSDSIRIMYVDEIDEAGAQMSTGEGNVLDVLDGRLIAFEGRSKMFSLSTPKITGDSSIDIQYDRGDKRKFMVPCPHCGKFQWLCLGDDKSNFGLKGDYVAGVLEQGYYLCFHCHEAIFNGHKEYMLKNGFWQPTVEHPEFKNTRSYHLPSFYSPFMSWTKMHQKHVDAEKKGDDGLRSFTNLYLGKSFEPTGERPEMKSIIEIRSKYKSGEVPNDIMWLTCAADVQPGAHKFKKFSNQDIDDYVEYHGKKKDKDGIPISWKKLRMLPRLEVEVMGHGRDRRTASIVYKKFYGNVDDYTSGAWAKLTNWITENPEGLYFKRADGFKFGIEYMFVDSGYGLYADVVYQYCEPLQRVYAIKGQGTKKQDKLKLTDIDEIKSGNIMRYKLSQSGSYSIVLINTNYYKGWLYRNLKNISKGELNQLPNSHITPKDYPDTYFEGLRAEKQKTDGSFHNLSNKANEPTDLWVYNTAAADFVIDNRILIKREQAMKKYRKLREGARVKNPAAMEKLREIANRDVILDEFQKELESNGW